jgi:hypothetical protein
MNRILQFYIIIFLTSLNSFAQSLGDYRSTGNANFVSSNNWQTYNGTSWISATIAPTSIPAGKNISILSGHTVTNSTANTTVVADILIFGILDITSDFNSASITINGTTGILKVKNAVKFYAYGDITVNANGTFNSNFNPGDSTLIVVYGNYNNNGITDFWKAEVLIVGNLTSPVTSTLQNNGNIVVGGNLIGQFDITGSGAGQIYYLDPNATVNLINASGGTITPSSNLTGESLTLQNLVLTMFGSCVASISTTWNGSSWSNGEPSISKSVVLAANFTGGNIVACSLKVNTGVSLTVNNNNFIQVRNDITNNGIISVEDGGSMIQINNSATYFSGNPISYKRKTTPLKQYDYTYWSSPVANPLLSQLATNSLFYSFNPSINNWVWQAGTTSMAKGAGYIGRSPSGLNYATPQIVETCFVGIPNNGDISIPIAKGTGAFNLIGNPYPSSIDIDLFLTDAANSGIVNGTVYLWTHNTVFTNNIYTTNDYAKYNFTGGIRTTSTFSGGVVPTGKIAAGQGFFIEASTALVSGTYNATFKNYMRILGNNNQFFRTSSPNVVNSNSISQGLEKHRIWLSLSNSQGAYNQMLVGYVKGATNELDVLYDGKTMPVGNVVSIYTILGNDDLSIQGKSLPFLESDIIPVAYSTTLNGELTISLDDFDGVFTSQNVYLSDKTTNTIHDLKNSPFTFVTTSGNFEERFELRFTNESLSTIIPTITDNDIKIITKNHQLEVISPAITISKIEVYDILGKLLFTQNDLNTNLFQTNTLQVSSQVLLVKVTLNNQYVFTKKTVLD